MSLVLNDRVQETASAPGTGAVSLLGAVLGFQTFSSGVGNGNTCYYCIADQGGANWEVGIGTYSSSGNTLARTTPLSGSSATPVNFSTGTQVVFVTYPAEKSVNLDASGNVSPLGTVASGTWQGTTLAIGYGGTGQTTASTAFNALSPITSTGDLIIGNGTNSATRLGIGTSGKVLTSNGTTASWSTTIAVTTGTTPPVTPSDGQLWYDTNTGILYAYYAASTAWVDNTPYLNAVDFVVYDGGCAGDNLPNTYLDGGLGAISNYYLQYIFDGGLANCIFSNSFDGGSASTVYTTFSTGIDPGLAYYQ